MSKRFPPTGGFDDPPGPSKRSKLEADVWGDDDDDEILLLASQACERIETTEITTVQETVSDMASNSHVQNLLRQLNAFKIQNERTAAERDRLAEKCLTKDGEVAILRTQLKNAHSQMGAMRMEKVKHQETSEVRWNERLKTADDRTESFKSQLDFKNLEIVNLKEKCRLLEMSKMKFVEPVPNLDSSKWTGFSQRINNNNLSRVELKQSPSTAENATQVDTTMNNIKLILTTGQSYPLSKAIDNRIFVASAKENPLVFNSDKYSQIREHSNFFETKQKPTTNEEIVADQIKTWFSKNNLQISQIHKHVANLKNHTEGQLNTCESSIKSQITIAYFTKLLLIKLHSQLLEIENKLTVLKRREMDEQYFKFSGNGADLLAKKSNFDENCWIKYEQSIEARRSLAIVASVGLLSKPLVDNILGISQSSKNIIEKELGKFIDVQKAVELFDPSCHLIPLLKKICDSIRKIGCSHLYIGIISSLCLVLKSCVQRAPGSCIQDIRSIVLDILLLRPHAVILKHLVHVLCLLGSSIETMKMLCSNSETNNLTLDYNEAVAFFDNDTCRLQLLCNNVELWTPHFTSISHMEDLFSITHNIIELHRIGTLSLLLWAKCDSENKCLCSIRMSRCLVICLLKCATLYEKHIFHLMDKSLEKNFNSVLRAGIMVLNFCVLNDIEFVTRLDDVEGHYQMFLSICNKFEEEMQLQDMHKEALCDLSNSVLPLLEEITEPSAEAMCIWENSFTNFSLDDR